MDFLTTTIYGIVQGLCEFLPISSSGHLALMPYVLNTPDPGPVFDLIMHLGTLFAVLIYFRKKIFLLLSSFYLQLRSRKRNEHSWFIEYFTITTGVTGVLALCFEPISKNYARDLLFIGFNSIFFGILLYTSHRKKITKENFFNTKGHYTSSIFLGIAQSIAVFPGVSRSGITLTTCRFLGVSPREACEFSFLLSLPPVFIGALVKIIKLENFSLLNMPLLWGLCLSFILGITTIHYFLQWISKSSPLIFCLYRIFLGLICIGVYVAK